jgi:hypothetical protein
MENKAKSFINVHKSETQLDEHEINHNGFSKGPTPAQLLPPLLVIATTTLTAV